MARRKSRYSGIGGQAVLEGVMMKNKEKYAVAVRKPDGEIDVEVETYQTFLNFEAAGALMSSRLMPPNPGAR